MLTYASYTDIFIADVTVTNKENGWVTVKDKNKKEYHLTAFGSKAVKEGKKKYAIWRRESEHFTFYHLR